MKIGRIIIEDPTKLWTPRTHRQTQATTNDPQDPWHQRRPKLKNNQLTSNITKHLLFSNLCIKRPTVKHSKFITSSCCLLVPACPCFSFTLPVLSASHLQKLKPHRNHRPNIKNPYGGRTVAHCWSHGGWHRRYDTSWTCMLDIRGQNWR